MLLLTDQLFFRSCCSRANRSPVVCDKDSYPLYELSTAGEVTEVLEFNWMESLFHVNDDPAVRAQLLELVNKKPIESPRPSNPPH